MNIRYRLIAFSLLILSVVAGACNPAPSTPTLSSTASSPTKISLMVFGDPAEIAAYQKIVEAYVAGHPDQQVELLPVPSQSEYRARLAADIAAGTPADVVLENYRRVAAFAVKHAFEPLGPYLFESKVIQVSDFYPQAIQAFTIGDQVVCIPQNISSPVIYYNQDLFEAAGAALPTDQWTWDDFLSAAQALTLDTDADGQIDQYGFGVSAELMRLAPFVWQNGGQLIDNYLTPTAFTLGSGPDLEAFQWFVDLQVKWHVVPSAEAEESEDSESRFINGRTAMYMNSRRSTTTFRESAKFNWDVAPMPVGKYRASVLHSDGYCVPATSQHLEAAWAFVEFANSVEGQTLIASTGRTVPSLIKVAESSAFLDPNQAPANSQVWLDAVPSIGTFPLLSTWVEIEELANAQIEGAFYGQVSVEEAASKINEFTGIEFQKGVSGETD